MKYYIKIQELSYTLRIIQYKVFRFFFSVYNRRQERRPSTTVRSSIYIVEDNGDVLGEFVLLIYLKRYIFNQILFVVINPRDGDVEKCDVKYSYENLAPPPYFVVLNTVAEASYELPPSYPIDT